jgi:SAM-dependent methyltransferase
MRVPREEFDLDRTQVLGTTEYFPLQIVEQRRDELAAVRHQLRVLGYSEAAVARTLQVKGPYAVGPIGREIWRRYHLSSDDPLHVVIRLLLLGHAEHEALVLELLGPDELTVLLDVGLLVRVAPERLVSPVSLYPIGDLYIATDWRWDEDASARAASMRVMPLGRDSYGLVRLAAWSGGRQAIDLCSGSGVIALAVAPGCEQVTGVDLNPRAVNFARFNAVFNAIDNCEFRKGDLYEAVAPQQVDLVTANPPFVPTPAVDTLLFRGGGTSGEDVLRRVIAGCADHLADGGTCLIVTDLVEHAGVEYDAKLADWLGPESGLTGVVFKAPGMTPYEYAIEHTHTRHRVSQELFEWIDHYQAQSIEAIAPGYIAIRKTGSVPCSTVTLPIDQPLQHPVPSEFLKGIFSRVTAAADLPALPLFPTYELGQVDLVGDGVDLARRQLPYLVASRIAALQEQHGAVSQSMLLQDLGNLGYEIGPERRSELEELLRALFIGGYFEPAGNRSLGELARTRRHRQAALRLWWSR